MRYRPRFTIFAVAAVLMAAAVPLLTEDAPAAADERVCCFTNPRYSGICMVTPGDDESCASILAYLNSPSSVGKTYCGGTSIRGGWQEVSCEAGAGVLGACSP